MCVCVRVFVCMYVYLSVCVCVCVCVCTCDTISILHTSSSLATDDEVVKLVILSRYFSVYNLFLSLQ